MPAPVGNKFWEMRSSHGRKPIFQTPEALEEACLEYFEWVEANPLHEAQAFAYQGAVKIEPVAKMRAMTVSGLCIFLDISQEAFGDYRKREGFSEVTRRADEIIRTQKFEGASAGLLNPSIIARDLGLADKSELSGPNGGPIRTEEVSAREILADRLAGLASRKPKSGDTGKSE